MIYSSLRCTPESNRKIYYDLNRNELEKYAISMLSILVQLQAFAILLKQDPTTSVFVKTS